MKRLAIEIGICAAVVLASAIVSSVYKLRAERANEDAQNAYEDAKRASAMWKEAEQKKRDLEALLSVYDKAFVFAEKQTQEAVKDYVERNSKIDKAGSGWLDESLPECLRNSFEEFLDCSTSSAFGTVPGSEGGEP